MKLTNKIIFIYVFLILYDNYDNAISDNIIRYKYRKHVARKWRSQYKLRLILIQHILQYHLS